MKLVNFFNKEKIELKEEISMYVCGPTVYDDPHIGNMRPIITFDILHRVALLKNKVVFVHNITDVDDKIIVRAKELGITEKEITEKYTKEYKELLEKLNIIKPTHLPLVTEHILGMISFIQELIDKNFAYESNGSVYFEVNKLTSYGIKDIINLEGLTENDALKEKRSQKDFVLWKKTSNGVKWDSPWGKGRPGWHTECAYFVKYFFGENGIDIHGGGIDLKFPHHINEMAQYEASTGNEMSKIWYYVGHLNIEKEKMSKSLNNFIKAKDFISEYGADTLRMMMILTNHQKPLNITNETILNSKNIILKIKNSIKKALVDLSSKFDIDINFESQPTKKFVEILNDNLNTVEAIDLILEHIKDLNLETEINRKARIVEEIVANLSLLGFKYNINYNNIRKEIENSKKNLNFDILDKLREGIIT